MRSDGDAPDLKIPDLRQLEYRDHMLRALRAIAEANALGITVQDDGFEDLIVTFPEQRGLSIEFSVCLLSFDELWIRTALSNFSMFPFPAISDRFFRTVEAMVHGTARVRVVRQSRFEMPVVAQLQVQNGAGWKTEASHWYWPRLPFLKRSERIFQNIFRPQEGAIDPL